MTTVHATPITNSVVSGEDIGHLIDRLLPLLQDQSIGCIVAATLSLAVAAQYPDISMETLQSVIESTSRHISKELSGLATTSKAPMVLVPGPSLPQ